MSDNFRERMILILATKEQKNLKKKMHSTDGNSS